MPDHTDVTVAKACKRDVHRLNAMYNDQICDTHNAIK